MEINFEQKWFPYDSNYIKSKEPLELHPGKVFEVSIRYCLGLWAHANGLTFAGVVAEDESYGFEIKIKPNPYNPSDWIYDN